MCYCDRPWFPWYVQLLGVEGIACPWPCPRQDDPYYMYRLWWGDKGLTAQKVLTTPTDILVIEDHVLSSQSYRIREAVKEAAEYYGVHEEDIHVNSDTY